MTTFSASIQADIDNFQANIGKATQSIDKFSQNVSKQLDKVGDSFIKTGTSISKFVSVPLTGLIAGMGALAISTAQATKDLDSLSTITGISTDMLQEYELIAIKATVPTDALANATRSLTRRLRDVSEEGAGASDVLKQLGISLKDANGEFKTAGQLSEEAIFALADLGGGIEASALGVQLFGRQWDDVTQIVDLGKDQIQALKQEAHDLGLVMSNDSVKASAEFGIAIDTLKLRFTALKNQIGTALAPMLTDTLLPIIENQIMPAIGQFADFIKQLIDRFNGLSTSTKTIIVSITGIAIALGPTLIALGGLLKLLPLISAGFTALTGPVGIAIAGIAAGAYLIIDNWTEVKEFFDTGLGKDLFEGLKNTLATIGFLTYSVGNEVAKFLRVLRNEINNTSETQKTWSDVLNDQKVWFNELTGLWEKGAKPIKSLTDNQKENSKVVRESVDIFKEAAKGAENYYKAIKPLSASESKINIGEIGSANPIAVIPTLNFDTVKDQMGQFWEYAELVSEEIATKIGSTVDNVIGSMANALAGAIASGDNVIGALATTLLDGLGNLAIEVGIITMGIGKAITAIFSAMANPLVAIGAGVALVALGVAMKATAGAINKASGSTSSGGASSTFRGGYDYNNLGQSEMRGAYATQDTVTFEIKGDTLVGILEKQSSKNNRLR